MWLRSREKRLDEVYLSDVTMPREKGWIVENALVESFLYSVLLSRVKDTRCNQYADKVCRLFAVSTDCIRVHAC